MNSLLLSHQNLMIKQFCPKYEILARAAAGPTLTAIPLMERKAVSSQMARVHPLQQPHFRRVLPAKHKEKAPLSAPLSSRLLSVTHAR